MNVPLPRELTAQQKADRAYWDHWRETTPGMNVDSSESLAKAIELSHDPYDDEGAW